MSSMQEDTSESATEGSSRFIYSPEEREVLIGLLRKYEHIIESRRTNSASLDAKAKAWDKLCAEYNSQPNIRPWTVKQLKKRWDNEKARWKKKKSEDTRDLYATGGGPQRCRPMSPSLTQVGAIASHMATRLPNPYDSDAVSQPVLSLQPAAIFQSMVETGHDYWTDGPASPPQQPAPAEAAASPAALQAGPPSPHLDMAAFSQRTSPPCAPPVSVLQPEASQTSAAAVQRGGRIAALQRMFAPEAEQRVSAFQAEEARKNKQHRLQMRMLREQMAHQRKRQKLELEILAVKLETKKRKLAALNVQPQG